MELNDFLLGVERSMLEAVRSEIPILQTTSHYIIEAGGKRIRPRVMALSFLAAGGTDVTKVIPVAAALEMIHTASLIHDDINDQGEYRRGRETINSHWGISYALLTGDYLFTRVYQIMSHYPELNRILAEATVTLVEGEALQATESSKSSLTGETYLEVIGKKTAALFKAAALLGGKLADGSDAVLSALEEFGYNLGLVFQITDDILDVVGDPAELGKSVQVDLKQGKGVIAAANPRDSREDPAIDLLLVEANSEKIIQEAFKNAERFGVAALRRVKELPNQEYATELSNLVEETLQRSK